MPRWDSNPRSQQAYPLRNIQNEGFHRTAAIFKFQVDRSWRRTFFIVEDECNTISRNVGKHSPNNSLTRHKTWMNSNLRYCAKVMYNVAQQSRQNGFFKLPRLRPLVVLLEATWKWVWSIGGVILTGETEVLREKHYTASVVDKWMSIELWWNDTDWGNWSTGRKTLYSVGGRWMNEYGALVEWYWQGKLKYREKNVSECHFFHQKAGTDQTALGSIPSLHGDRLAINRLSYSTASTT
jgi:hypothetical protein